ncbi:MAG: DUF2156 domain-containing protein [Deltaproteobacteria bacterium]|nr:DUF2156 domain-containing protein [Deltaproteobacteria bacterium]
MDIPLYPDRCELGIEHCDALQRAFRAVDRSISEFTFSNLFLFRKAHSYRVSRLGEFLIVTGRGYDGTAYALPPLGPGDPENASLRVCDGLAAEGHEPVLFPVHARLLESSFSDPRWSARADRDQADYVYSRSELAELSGRKYHKRKNRLLKFVREEAQGYSYAPLSREHVSGCLELAEAWCEIRCSPTRPSTYLETEAAEESLRWREALGLRGAVVTIAGRVRAFTLGEELNPETFVIHFEKSDAGREGLAQLINRDFCSRALGAYRYVNREQDLGDPGLRQAKEAYQPLFLVEKYRVSPR